MMQLINHRDIEVTSPLETFTQLDWLAFVLIGDKGESACS
jgi:hypothetical protein